MRMRILDWLRRLLGRLEGLLGFGRDTHRGGHEMTTVGPAFAKMRSTLDSLPRDGSVAAAERSSYGEIAKAAHTQADWAIRAVADHMRGLERQLVVPVMTRSPWTTARGALEAAAIAMWLLEDISTATRLGRSLTLRLEHLRSEGTYFRDDLQRRPDVSSLAQAIRHVDARETRLVDRATQLKIPIKRDRSKQRVIGFGAVMPSITDLADQQLGEGSTYRLLAAAAHGRSWAIIALSLRRVMIEGDLQMEESLAPESAGWLIVSTIDWFARPVWKYFHLNGWDLRSLEVIYEKAYDEALFLETTRFWRTARSER